MFYQNEPRYETWLRVSPPTGLRFPPGKPAVAQQSVTKFKKWFADRLSDATAIAKGYQELVDIATSGGRNINAAAWGIAAAAREAEINQNFAGELFTFEIPREVRQDGQDAIDAYCDAVADIAVPLEETAVRGYSFCLASSNQLSSFNTWSQLCESELSQIRPQDFPVAGEIRASAENIGNMIDSQSIVARVAPSGP
jgi:hypothetical protein